MTESASRSSRRAIHRWIGPTTRTVLDFQEVKLLPHFTCGLVRRFPKPLRCTPTNRSLLSCHGGVMDAALRHALKVAQVGLFDIHTLNTSITEMHLVRPGRWRLIRYNDHAHLAGLPTETVQASAS